MNHHKLAFFLTLIIAVVLGIFGAVYLHEVDKDIAASSQEVSDLASSTPTTPPQPSYAYYAGSTTALYEDTNTLSYILAYDPTVIYITASTTLDDNKRGIVLTDEQTGQYAEVYFSYEGGRGFTPTDYQNNILKSSCPSCTVRQADGDQSWLIITSSSSDDASLVETLSTLQIQTTFETDAPPSVPASPTNNKKTIPSVE